MIVFGDSLSDAGRFGCVRFTNLDANGNYAPVSPMILSGRLGVNPTELGPRAAPSALQPDSGRQLPPERRRAAGPHLAAHSSNWQLAPFISADYARVKVDGYDEKSGRSTSLGFDDQARTSRRLGLGSQGTVQVLPSTRLFTEVAQEHEFEDDRQDVTMHLTSLPANDFTLTGYTPHSDLTRASLGVSHEVVAGVHLRGNYNWRKSDELTQQGVSLGISMDF